MYKDFGIESLTLKLVSAGMKVMQIVTSMKNNPSEIRHWSLCNNSLGSEKFPQDIYNYKVKKGKVINWKRK